MLTALGLSAAFPLGYKMAPNILEDLHAALESARPVLDEYPDETEEVSELASSSLLQS